MKVFRHLIYEYKKGVRDFVIYTTLSLNRKDIELILCKNKIDYKIFEVNNEKINVIFGKRYCVDVFNRIGKSIFEHFSVEEDFIIGTMLGYSLKEQCDHFLKRSKNINSNKGE